MLLVSRGFKAATVTGVLAAGLGGVTLSCASRSARPVYLDNASATAPATAPATASAPAPTLPVVRRLVRLREVFKETPDVAASAIALELQWAAATRYDLNEMDGTPPVPFDPPYTPRQLETDAAIVAGELLRASSSRHRVVILTVLGSLGRYAAPYAAQVAGHADPGGPGPERVAALTVLARAGTGDARARRVLDAALKDPDETVRRIAERAEPPPAFVGVAAAPRATTGAATQAGAEARDLVLPTAADLSLPRLPVDDANAALRASLKASEPWVYQLELLGDKLESNPKVAYAEMADYVEYVRNRRFDVPFDDSRPGANWPQRFSPDQYRADAALVARHLIVAKTTEHRQVALAFLLPLGRYAAPYVDAVERSARSTVPGERRLALMILARCAADDAEARAAFATALKDPDAAVRLEAIREWAAWPASAEWVRLLEPLLRDPNADVARVAVARLIAAAPASGAAGAALVPFIHAEDPDLRRAARDAFARPSARAGASVDVLIDALRDEDPQFRREAARALAERHVDRDEVMGALVAAVDRGDFVVRVALTDALERAALLRTDSLTALTETAEDEADPTARAYARVALRRVAEAR